MKGGKTLRKNKNKLPVCRKRNRADKNKDKKH